MGTSWIHSGLKGERGREREDVWWDAGLKWVQFGYI